MDQRINITMEQWNITVDQRTEKTMVKFYIHYALGGINTLSSAPSGERNRCQRFTADQWKVLMEALTWLSIYCAGVELSKSNEALHSANQEECSIWRELRIAKYYITLYCFIIILSYWIL